MKKALIGLLVLMSIVGMTILVGCNQEEINNLKAKSEALKKENSELKRHITALKKEIDDLKFGASRLLNTAREAITKKHWTDAEMALEDLIKKHPGSLESKEATVLLKKLRVERIKEIDERLAAEKRRKKKEAKRLARALKNMKKKKDNVENITWYTPKNTPKYHLDNGACFYMYIGTGDGHVWPRLVVRYDGNDWVFFDKILVKYDDRLAEIEFDKYKNKKTDTSSGVAEWIDIAANPLIMTYLKEIANAKKVTIRFSGKYSKDFVLTGAQKRALRDSLLAFRVLNQR